MMARTLFFLVAMIENSKKILIVDDDTDLCNLISDILKRNGYECTKAFDYTRAFALINTRKFDLLISDYRIGGKSGIKLIEDSKKVQPKLKLIMLSAYTDEKVKIRAASGGVEYFLDKPFDVSHLVEIVNNLLLNYSKDND